MKNPLIIYFFLTVAFNVQAQYYDSNEIFNTNSYGVSLFKEETNLYISCNVNFKDITQSKGWLVLDTSLNYVRSFVPKDTIRYSSGSLYHDGYLVQCGQSTVNKADSVILVKMDTLGNILKRKVYSTKDNGTRRYSPIKYHNNKYYVGISVRVTATQLDRMMIEVYDSNLEFEKSIKIPVSAGGLDLINFIVVEDNSFIVEYVSYSGFQEATYHSIISFFAIGNTTVTRWKYKEDDPNLPTTRGVDMEATKDSGAIIVQVYECITDTCNFIQNQHELIRFDKNGKKVWHTKNISNKAHYQDLIKLLLTSDEGIIMVQTDSDLDPNTNEITYSLELKKFNNKGEFEWSRTHYWPKNYRNFVVGGLSINSNTFAVTGWRLFANLAGSNPPIEQDATWVMLLDSMGCPKNTPNCSEINYLSTNDIKVPLDRGNEELTVYPNPANTSIRLALDYEGLMEIKVYNSIGIVVMSRSINSNDSIDISAWANGLYYIQVQKEGTIENYFTRFVKQ